jgi:uncharacterized protein (DUF1501 family)
MTNVKISRRQALQTLGLASLSLAPGVQVLAAPQAVQQRLLVVFLRGAYDATNVLIPYSSSFYHEVRPTIAVPKPGSGEGAALELSADWALHPALRESLLPLWQAKSLAFVPFSGLDDPSRSHFEMQDKIEFGRGSDSRDYSSGFLNRLALELPQLRPVSFTDTPSIALRGALRVPNIGLQDAAVAQGGMEDTRAQQIARMYEGNPLAGSVQDGFATRSTVKRELSMEMQMAGRGAASPRGFGTVAAKLAKLLRDPYRLAFIDIGRWDTHVNQGAATGGLADRLGELGDGLAVLANGLGDAWQNTTVVVVSEFGRTFQENGNRGTDHGHGSALWVLGGSVRGGKVLGEQVASEAKNLHENRDWPVLNDYRAVLGGVFGRLYGLNGAALARVFPGARPVDVGLI